MNEAYTDIWTTDFNFAAAEKHDKRFRHKFEKNIKHRQQVALVKKHVGSGAKWLDFPVGPARFMREISAGQKYGYDISDGFLEFSSKHGVVCRKQDLFSPVDSSEQFDVLTSFHAIFAFNIQDQISILIKFHRLLNEGGILIFDPVNRRCREKRNNYGNDLVPDNNCLYKEELQPFLKAIGFEIQSITPHDCIDNPKFIAFLRRFGLYRYLNKAYFVFRIYPILNMLTKLLPEFCNSKFIVVAKKTNAVEL